MTQLHTSDDAEYLPSPRRVGAVLAVVAAILVALIVRVAYLQTAVASRLAEQAGRQQIGGVPVPARRGGIFDRNGLLLAATVEARRVFADPKFMHEQFAGRVADGEATWFDLDLTLERVAEQLGTDPGRLALAVGRDANKRYVPLARGLAKEEADAVVSLARGAGVRGLSGEAEPRRLYPLGQTAAHVLGTVGRDGDGLEGLEQRQNDLLSGENGRLVTLRDKRRRPVDAALTGYRPPRHGDGLVLTIDAQIQLIAEQELAATCRAFGAEGGSVVVLDPHTGDVLALANHPAYFPQFPADSTASDRRNRAVVDPYEPGSVMKPFLIAALLDAGLTDLGEMHEIGGSHRLPVGRRVTDFHWYDELTTWDVLVKSSNIGMAKLADRMSYEQVRDAYRRFGFGGPTGLGLGGESGGLLYDSPPDKYTQSSMSFGYAVMATPVQLARAMAAVANGGVLPAVRTVAGRVGPDGAFVPADAGAGERVTTRATADLLKRVMADAFVRGTARHARSEKYNFFGKTGTAHKSDGAGRQSDEKYWASFLGGGPHESPRLVIAVSVNEPDKRLGHQGGQVAGGTAARVLERSLLHLGVPLSPSLPEPPELIREDLHLYRENLYDPERTLTPDPAMDVNEEARNANAPT